MARGAGPDAVPPVPAGPDAVAVVTVNWNGWRETRGCVEALRESRGADWHLLVIDNASTDDSLARLSDLDNDATLIASPVNGGWTGGNNLGVERALAAGYRWILILNNDAFVEPDTIAGLLEAARAAGPEAIVGPVHLTGDGGAYDFVGTTANPRTGFPLWRGTTDAEVARLPDLIATWTIKGAGVLVRAEQFARLGLFDDAFYLNFDETDWCFRARKAGYRLFMVKAARIRHLGSASIGGVSSPLQAYFLVRNALLFAERHCNAGQRWRLMRELYWNARDLPRDDASRHGWLWRFVRRPSPAQRAFRLGLRDYALRRFGECPSLVRDLNRQAR